MILSGTGHRPRRLGLSYSRADLDKLTEFAIDYFCSLDSNAFLFMSLISGMALGWDQALALAAIELEIPFTAAIPFDRQERAWPKTAQDLYTEILAKASRVVCLGSRNAVMPSFHARDRWMIDNCDEVLALFDGAAHGGTFKTLQYAESKKKNVINLWDEWSKIK